MRKVFFVLAFLLFLSPTAWANHAVKDMADGTWVGNQRYISFGSVIGDGHYVDSTLAVRPAFKINLSSNIFESLFVSYATAE